MHKMKKHNKILKKVEELSSKSDPNEKVATLKAEGEDRSRGVERYFFCLDSHGRNF